MTRVLAPVAPTQSEPRRRVLVAQLAQPVRTFLANEAGSAGVLLAATVVALLWANSPWSDSYVSLWHTDLAVRLGDARLAKDLGHWVDDGLMVLFFFVVGLEVRRELSMGELTDRRNLVVPGLAALGGLIVPALIYLALNPSGEAARGWGAVIGTDTAFLLGALALVGPRSSTQLRVFLLTLSIADDVLAVAAIGAISTDALDPGALALALGAAAAVLAMAVASALWPRPAPVSAEALLARAQGMGDAAGARSYHLQATLTEGV